MPTNDVSHPTDALRAASGRRLELAQAISSVEDAAASASADPTWRSDLVAALDGLAAALSAHVDEVEGPDGLLAELLDRAPRFAGRVAGLRDEHDVLSHQVDDAIAATRGGRGVADVRSAVLVALTGFAQHRQRGADLVYEVYEVDIGGG